MTQPAIQIKAVSKLFGSTKAVNDVNLDIAGGEFFSLLGPSGCGKTTLLRMIAGFEHPTSGQIVVAGKDMAGVPPHKRPVNMVFQSYALFPHLSVFDNVAFGLRSAGVRNREELQSRVAEALNLVRLSAFTSRFPSELSGGQQQRVALARAVVNRPAVLLLDEPLSALDLKIRQEMQEELARLQKQLQMTFVMVTHDQGEALALSDRMAVFYQGNLEQSGSPDEIYRAPRTAFVADFIGQTNLLDAAVVEHKTPYILVDACSSLKVWARCDTSYGAGQNVKVWMRTDVLDISASSEAAAPAESTASAPLNRFNAVVTSRSYQGTTTEYRLAIDDKLSLRATCQNNSQALFALGQKVTVSFSADQASVLPCEDSGPGESRQANSRCADIATAAVNGGARQIG